MTGDEWEPEPAALHDDETADISAHARRNLAQIRMAVEEGVLEEEDYEDAKERALAQEGDE